MMESFETGIHRQMERNDHTVIDIENPYVQLVTSMMNELEKLYPLSSQCTIHKAPERLRQLDEKAYTPRIISIGPIHYGREELKEMEKYKRRYLQRFLQRANVSLEVFIKKIKEKEAMVRSCYAENIELNSDDFVKMILMDAAFIIEVLLRKFIKDFSRDDRVYGNPRHIHDVKDDLCKVENQIPFFILEDLYKLANISIHRSNEEERPSLIKMTYEFCKSRYSFLGMEDILEENKYSGVKHLLDFLYISIIPSNIPKESRPKVLTVPSVTKLHQAGVKFKLASNKNLFQLRFANGIIEIPQIRIRAPTEYLLKNLLALEQCQRSEKILNDYVVLINFLISTSKDVKLLVEKEIIENRLGDNEAASTLIHDIAKNLTYKVQYFSFSSLVEDLNRYCRNPWHKWKATLKQDYFNTPWASISVIGAVILIVLTIIQAVCSIVQVK